MLGTQQQGVTGTAPRRWRCLPVAMPATMRLQQAAAVIVTARTTITIITSSSRAGGLVFCHPGCSCGLTPPSSILREQHQRQLSSPCPALLRQNPQTLPDLHPCFTSLAPLKPLAWDCLGGAEQGVLLRWDLLQPAARTLGAGGCWHGPEPRPQTPPPSPAKSSPCAWLGAAGS